MISSLPMMNITVRSLDVRLVPVVLTELPLPARIHSVFKRTLNLVLDDGRVISLVSHDIDNAPDTIVTPCRDFLAWNLSPGLLADWRFDCPAGRPWQATLPSFPLRLRALQSKLNAAQQLLLDYGSGPLIDALRPAAELQPPPPGIHAALIAALRNHTQSLCAHLARGERLAAQAAARSLLGLGPGLTPSGDDFLLGLLVALSLPNAPSNAGRDLGEYICRAAPTATNTISATALLHAAHGRARERIIRFLTHLVSGQEAEMRKSLFEVLTIGSSSGTDIAAGIIAGFKIHGHRPRHEFSLSAPIQFLD